MKSFYPSPKILILQKLNNKCAMTEQQKRLCENDNLSRDVTLNMEEVSVKKGFVFNIPIYCRAIDIAR